MRPHHTALVFGDRSWTYGQLDRRIRRLAHAFAQRGIDAGDRIAFVGHNHPAALETLFACGLLGAIAVPVHPGFDRGAMDRVFADARPAAVVVTPELVGAVQRCPQAARVPRWFTTEPATRPAACVENLGDLIDAGSDEPIDRPLALDDTCLLAFSSGTTGRNKGVMLSHGNVLFNALNVLSCLDYMRDDVILTSAPLYRMGGLGFLMALFIKGGTCILQERSDADASVRLIEQHRVSIWFDSVASLEAVARSSRFARADLSSLRICVTGGSPVPAQLVEAFRGRGLVLQPGYGLTEASPLALLVDREEVDGHPDAAGRPPMFCAVRVVDREGGEVATGQIGELLVHGPNVMQGYWRRPDATRQALNRDGWLRTGDVARVAANGMISVVGRASDALVLAGKAVHPEPLEERMRRQAGVLDCAVVQDGPNRRPVLFVVADGSRTLDDDTLRSLCRRWLGGNADPNLHFLSALPKNPNGKIVRTRLRALLDEVATAATAG